jgi:hypothetical protein
MNSESIQTIQSLIWLVVLICLPILSVYLIIVLGRLAAVLKNANKISNDAAYISTKIRTISENDADLKLFVADVAAGTANGVIDHQSQRIVKTFIINSIQSAVNKFVK